MNNDHSNLEFDVSRKTEDYLQRFRILSRAELILQSADEKFNNVGQDYYRKSPFIGRGLAVFGTRLRINPLNDGVEYTVEGRQHDSTHMLRLHANVGKYGLQFIPISHAIGALPISRRPEMTLQEILDGGEETAPYTEVFVRQAGKVGAYATTCVGLYNRNEIALESAKDFLAQNGR